MSNLPTIGFQEFDQNLMEFRNLLVQADSVYSKDLARRKAAFSQIAQAYGQPADSLDHIA